MTAKIYGTHNEEKRLEKLTLSGHSEIKMKRQSVWVNGRQDKDELFRAIKRRKLRRAMITCILNLQSL